MNISGQWLKNLTSNVSTVVPLLREDVYYIDACVLNKWLEVPLYTEASRMGSWQSTLKINTTDCFPNSNGLVKSYKSRK